MTIYVQSVSWLEYICSPELPRFLKCTFLRRRVQQPFYGPFHAFNCVLISPLHPISDTDIASPKHNLQLVLLGDSGVGKSCIVLRFVRGQFDPTSKV